MEKEYEFFKYGTREMFWKYLEWKRVNNPGPDVPPWPYYDPDSQEYGCFGGPYPSLEEVEDVKAWLDDLEFRMYGMKGAYLSVPERTKA